jgi:hypothetical protein
VRDDRRSPAGTSALRERLSGSRSATLVVVDIPSAPLVGDGVVTRHFRDRGVTDFAAAARLVRALPYGRTSRRDDVTLVLREGRGTCSTKHALLATLARELRLDLVLTLGIYEMCEANTPGVGPVLARHGLASIPEAHCYLVHGTRRIDVTRDVEAAQPIATFLHEEAIQPEQIGDYKVELHRRVLADWMRGHAEVKRRTLADLWAIREECIASLSGPSA